MSYGSRHPDHPGGLILQSAMARFDLVRVVDGFRDKHGEEVADIVRRSYLREVDRGSSLTRSQPG